MKPEELMDAMGHLPADLITATDRCRRGEKRPVIQLHRWIPAAACLALLLAGSLVMGQPKGMEEPAEQAPLEMSMEKGSAVDAPADEAPQNGKTTGGNPEVPMADSAAGGEHRHGFAEEQEPAETSAGAFGEVTVFLGKETHILEGEDAARVAEILAGLEYDPVRLCRCMAEFTVETEHMPAVQINLQQAFARCETGQADLTEAQVMTLRAVLERLK